MSVPRIAVRVIALVTAVVVVAEIAVVAVAGRFADRVYIGIAVCISVTTVALAVLVSQRRPANLVAPLLSCMALLAALVPFSDVYEPARARRPDLLPALPGVAVAMLVVLWVWLYVSVALLMLLFPDGRLPGRRWRWVGGCLLGVALAIQVLMIVAPGPYDAPYADAVHPFGDLPSGLALGLKIALFPTLVGLVVACAASMWVRFRRGDQIVRAQVKWLALAALGLPATAVLSWVGFLLTGTNDLAGFGLAFLYVAVPVAVTIAILKHNLYDVDRALSAAVTYGAATVSLLAVFTVASVASGVLLGQSSVAVAAGITAVTAVALAPVRTRLQRGVDRRLYPMRRAALQAIDDVRASISVHEGGPEQLQEALRVALGDPALRVGFLVPGGTGFVDAFGQALQLRASATPVMVRGQQIGAIATDGPASPELLHEVAAASALLIEMGRLRLEASGALREAESSRARLQRLGYEERRRLERDLHDGAQQRLVSLGMSLRLAQRHLRDSTVDVDGLLDESVAQLGTAVAELREVAHGLRPSCLDDGLYPAISVLAQSVPLPMDLDVAADRAVPDDIATTAYYVVSEAVANAVKHAEASRIALRIAHDDGQLRVCIEDDGLGGATIRPGSGLAGLSDRVAAAGGSLLVHSAPGKGTLVEALLPCAS
jgi:signal transduction histidine kinase